MVGLLQAVVETPSGAGKVLLSGNLEFMQDQAIHLDASNQLYNYDPILSSYKTMSLNEIIDLYQAREEKLQFNYDSLVQPYASPYTTSIDMKIKIPKN